MYRHIIITSDNLSSKTKENYEDRIIDFLSGYLFLILLIDILSDIN